MPATATASGTLPPFPGAVTPTDPAELGGQRQRRRHRWLTAALAAALVVTAGTALDLARRPAAPKAPLVMLAPVTRGLVVGTVRVHGWVEPANAVVLTQPVAGRLIRAAVEPGDRVTRGQILARFDPVPLRADLAQAEARLVAAEAAAYEAEVKLAQILQRLDSARDRRFPEPDEGETSDMEAVAEIAQARASSALAEVAARAARFRMEHRRLSATVVRAPGDGYVLGRDVAEGQIVQAGAPLYTFAFEPARLHAAVAIPEDRMGKVEAGQEVQLTTPVFPGRTFAGRVERVLPLRGREAGVRLPVRIAIDHPDGLRPGMTVAATIRTPSARDVMRVPSAALFFAPRAMTATADDPAVWVAEDGGVALSRVRVEVGAMDGSFAEVRAAGLREGAAVAVGFSGAR